MPIRAVLAALRLCPTLLLMSFSAFAAAAAPSAHPGWGQRITVDKPNAHGELLKSIFQHTIAHGGTADVAARVVGDLRIYMNGMTEAGGTVTLAPQLVIDAVEAASGAHWSPGDSAAELLRLQWQLDGGRISEAQLQVAVLNIRLNPRRAAIASR